MTEKSKPKINIRFLFNICNDIDEMKKFYTDFLGMQQVSYMNDSSFGWLCYQCEGFQFMFFRSDIPIPVNEIWDSQPGYQGGEGNRTSWAIEVPENEFKDKVIKIQQSDIRKFNTNPEWRQDNYWGLSIMDPMGNTIEFYTSPKEKPKSTNWTEQ